MSDAVLSGFPPKQIVTDDDAPATNYFKSGDTIVVQARGVASSKRAASPQPLVAPTRVAAPPKVPLSAAAASIASQGTMVIREVPDDNSCLFRAVNGILGRASASAAPLRVVVAKAISANTAMYNEAFLGRPNAAYGQWITSTNAWGGAIELGILAMHFKMEIGAFDVKTMRMDRYGEGNSFQHIGYLIYDGIHYNYLALALSGDPTNRSADVCQFPRDDAYAMDKAHDVALLAHQAKQYTDTQNFLLKCDDCGLRLRGEADAVKHATATSHGNFSEAN